MLTIVHQEKNPSEELNPPNLLLYLSDQPQHFHFPSYHRFLGQIMLVYALEPIGLDKGYVVIQCINNHITLCDRGFPSC